MLENKLRRRKEVKKLCQYLCRESGYAPTHGFLTFTGKNSMISEFRIVLWSGITSDVWIPMCTIFVSITYILLPTHTRKTLNSVIEAWMKHVLYRIRFGMQWILIRVLFFFMKFPRWLFNIFCIYARLEKKWWYLRLQVHTCTVHIKYMFKFLKMLYRLQITLQVCLITV